MTMGAWVMLFVGGIILFGGFGTCLLVSVLHGRKNPKR